MAPDCPVTDRTSTNQLTTDAPISVVLAFSKSVGKWHSGTHILTALAVDGRCR